MNTKHTPGPWTIRYDREDNEVNGAIIGATITAEPTRAVACIYGIETNERTARIANARLIASAPELLDALEKSANVIAHCISEMPEAYRKAMRTQLASARTAIAKATGENI